MISTESLIPGPDGPGFVSVEALRFREFVGEEALPDWAAFAQSWNHLETDVYMADGGRSRRRRFARFLVGPSGLTLEPHGPHYQSAEYNPLNGGVDRWFAPVTEEIAWHPLTGRILTLGADVFNRGRDRGTPASPWKVEMHQFRIEPVEGGPGKPTPEGMHRDGVDWAFVLLIDRANVAGGVTAISDSAGRPLGSFTLSHPLDAVFLDDRRVRHGVTPIELLDRSLPGHRDVLVLTYRRG